jgi:hypothetical protein
MALSPDKRLPQLHPFNFLNNVPAFFAAGFSRRQRKSETTTPIKATVVLLSVTALSFSPNH